MLADVQDLVWVPMGLWAAMMTALLLVVTEHFKFPSAQYLGLLRVISFLFLLPGACLLPWPQTATFYIATGAGIALISIMDIFMITASVKNGAGVTSRILPLSVFATFFLWTAISPMLWVEYTNNLLKTGGIVFSITLAGLCTLRLRQCEMSRAAMKVLIPAVIMSAVVSVCAKIAVDSSPETGAYYWAFLQTVVLSPFYFLIIRAMPQRFESVKITRAFWLAAGIGAFASVTHILLKIKAYNFVENPAYVLILLLTSPLWVLVFNRVKGQRENTDIYAGLGIVLAAMCLIICTRL